MIVLFYFLFLRLQCLTIYFESILIINVTKTLHQLKYILFLLNFKFGCKYFKILYSINNIIIETKILKFE